MSAEKSSHNQGLCRQIARSASRALLRRTLPKLLVGTALLCGLLLPFAVALPRYAHAQTPPIEETPPTEAGLGAYDDTMKLGVLDDDFNTLPEDLVKPQGSGGFEALIPTNYILVTVNWNEVDCFGV